MTIIFQQCSKGMAYLLIYKNLQVINSAKKIKEKTYRELSKRIEREKHLTVVQQKMEIKRHLQDVTVLKPKRVKKGSAVSAPVYKFQFIRKK